MIRNTIYDSQTLTAEHAKGDALNVTNDSFEMNAVVADRTYRLYKVCIDLTQGEARSPTRPWLKVHLYLSSCSLAAFSRPRSHHSCKIALHSIHFFGFFLFSLSL